MNDEEKRDFPRSPKTVPPEKLATRQAANKLEAVGFKIIHSSYGMKNLYFLAKEAPELLERVLAAMLDSSDRQRDLWGHIIGNEMGFRYDKSITRDPRFFYERWLLMIPAADALYDDTEGPLERKLSWIGWEVDKFDKNLRYSDARRYVAAVIILRIRDSRVGIKTDLSKHLSDLDFISRNIGRVTPVLSELMKRGSTDQGTIEALLGSASPSLLEGVL